MTACSQCGYDPEDQSVLVNSETVIDHFETWLARPNGKNPARITERVLVITLNGASHHGKNARGTTEGSRRVEQLETRQRAERMVPVHEADPAGTVARRRRPAVESRRQPGR